MATNDSSSNPSVLLEIARGLRILLRDAELDDKPWFAFAEALIHTRDAAWWPLLGKPIHRQTDRRKRKRRPWFDVLIHQAHKPPAYYARMLEAIQNQKLKTFIKILEDTMAKGSAIKPVLRFLPSNPSHFIESTTWPARLDKIRELLPGFVVYDQDTKTAAIKYCKEVRDERWVDDSLTGLMFPPSSLSISIPLLRELGGRPILLGVVLLFVDAALLEGDLNERHHQKAARTFTDKLFRGVNAFALSAQYYVSARYSDQIVGTFPMAQPFERIVVPGYSDKQFFEDLKLRQSTPHDSPEKIRWWSLGENLKYIDKFKVLGITEAFEQTTLAVKRVFKDQKRNLLDGLESSSEIPCEAQLAALPLSTRIRGPRFTVSYKSYRAITSTAHRWIKVLYSFEEPGDLASKEHYDLFPENLIWLAALLEESLSSKLSEGNSQEELRLDLSDHFRGEYPAEWSGKVRIDPPLHCMGRIRGEDGRQGGCGFWMPVQPGARFVAPLLEFAQAFGGSIQNCTLSRCCSYEAERMASVKFKFNDQLNFAQLQNWKAILEDVELAEHRSTGRDSSLLRTIKRAELRDVIRGLVVGQHARDQVFEATTETISAKADADQRTLEFSWKWGSGS